MALINSDVIPVGATGGGAGYTIDQSLRFNDDDSAYLSRTPSSAGNRKTWTWSAWIKRSAISNNNSVVFGAGNTANPDTFTFGWYGNYADQFIIMKDGSYILITSAKYRDAGAWYHIVIKSDTTQSTATDRLKLYINGEEVTAFDTDNRSANISQNEDWFINNTTLHALGKDSYYGTYHDGYMAEVHHIDGTALDSSYFGETDETYGHWKPIRYSGSYGTNGFYLDFDGTYYNDKSGNGNNFTATNLATTDVVLDSPSNNFCTLNPLNKFSQFTLSEGNLKNTNGSTWDRWIGSTMAMSSGKWYWECALDVDSSGTLMDFAIVSVEEELTTQAYPDYSAYGVRWYNGNKMQQSNWNSGTSYGSAFSSGDIGMVAFDADNGKIWFGKNGTWFNSGNPASGTNEAYSSITGTYVAGFFWGTGFGTHNDIMNFGQDSSFVGYKTAQGNTDDNSVGDFYYSPPSGFLALCTANLDDPAVIPSEQFNTILYTGDGTNPRSFTGVGFQPDFVWYKRRSATGDHQLVDAVRIGSSGNDNTIFSNNTLGETDIYSPNGGIVSLDSDGFSTAGSSTNNNPNWGSTTYVAWNWKANGSGSSNTNGSTTSTVSTNQDNGFSIIKYSGTGSTATIGHGLSKKPQLIFHKKTSAGQQWTVYSETIGATKYLELNENYAANSASTPFNNTEPTSSVWTVGTANGTNGSGQTYIAYAFHSVDGFSKVGSYVGNNSTDGPFIYTGFKPAYIMVKNTSTAESWRVFDNKRYGYNNQTAVMTPNANYTEQAPSSQYWSDFVSNGWKIRHTSYNGPNASGDTYIFLAFAENPFKYTNGE